MHTGLRSGPSRKRRVLVPARGPTRAVGTLVWSAVLWWFSERLGGLANGHVSGPGATLLYAILAPPPGRPSTIARRPVPPWNGCRMPARAVGDPVDLRAHLQERGVSGAGVGFSAVGTRGADGLCGRRSGDWGGGKCPMQEQSRPVMLRATPSMRWRLEKRRRGLRGMPSSRLAWPRRAGPV
jgi:hypothetical protein